MIAFFLKTCRGCSTRFLVLIIFSRGEMSGLLVWESWCCLGITFLFKFDWLYDTIKMRKGLRIVPYNTTEILMKTMLTLSVIACFIPFGDGCAADDSWIEKALSKAAEAEKVSQMSESERLTYTVEELEAAATETSEATFTVRSDHPAFTLTVPQIFTPTALKHVTGNPNEAFFIHFTEVGSPVITDDDWSPDSLDPEMAFIIYKYNDWPLKEIKGLSYVGDGTSVPVKIGDTDFGRFNAISLVPMVSYVTVKEPYIYQFVLKAYPAQFTDLSHAQQINEAMMSILHSFKLN